MLLVLIVKYKLLAIFSDIICQSTRSILDFLVFDSKFKLMIQNHSQIIYAIDSIFKEHVKEFDKDNQINGKIQKIYSTPHFVSFEIRIPGKSFCLYLGRGNHFEGIWWSSSRPESKYRIRDQYLEYLRSHLMNVFLKTIRVDSKKRIISFEYSYQNEEHLFAIYYREREAFFINTLSKADTSSSQRCTRNTDERMVFLSWKGVENIKEQSHVLNYVDLFALINKVNEESLNQKKSVQVDLQIEINNYFTYLDKELDKLSNSIVKKKLKFLKRKEENISNDLVKARAWYELKKMIDVDRNQIEKARSIDLNFVKIKFFTGMSIFQKVDLIYKKIKALKNGEKIIVERLSQVRKEIASEESKSSRDSVAIYKIKKVSPIISRAIGEQVLGKNESNVENNFKNSLENKNDYDEFIFKDMRVAVGRNSHGNDQIRNSWAKKEDYWLHIEGEKSSHLIIKCSSLERLTIEDFRVLASALREYSKIDFQQIPIIFTQVKNLKSIKGARGAVLYKKHKQMVLQYNPDWKKLIR